MIVQTGPFDTDRINRQLVWHKLKILINFMVEIDYTKKFTFIQYNSNTCNMKQVQMLARKRETAIFTYSSTTKKNCSCMQE